MVIDAMLLAALHPLSDACSHVSAIYVICACSTSFGGCRDCVDVLRAQHDLNRFAGIELASTNELPMGFR